MDNAVTCLPSENAWLQCVQFQTTQLMVLSDHRLKEINPDSETAVNIKETRLTALHKSQDEELKAMIEQVKHILLDAKNTEMLLHVENPVNESSMRRR